MTRAPPSFKHLTFVWLALLLLLAITLASAYIPLGGFNAAVNLGIAGTKAAVVLLFFMHVRGASPAIKLIAAVGWFWLMILISLGLGDFLAR